MSTSRVRVTSGQSRLKSAISRLNVILHLCFDRFPATDERTGLRQKSARRNANRMPVPMLTQVSPTAQEFAMPATVKPIPDGFHTITPYLIVEGAEKLIGFMKEAFGAQAGHPPTKRPDGSIMHATLKIGDSMLMLSDASQHAKASPVMLYLYVSDVDAAYQRALKAGATSMMEPADQFYGDRSAGVKDGAGNQWFFGMHIEDVSPAELEKRAAEFFKKQGNAA
jgi:PhnB protein